MQAKEGTQMANQARTNRCPSRCALLVAPAIAAALGLLVAFGIAVLEPSAPAWSLLQAAALLAAGWIPARLALEVAAYCAADAWRPERRAVRVAELGRRPVRRPGHVHPQLRPGSPARPGSAAVRRRAHLNRKERRTTMSELTPLKILFQGYLARFNELRKPENRESGMGTVELIVIAGALVLIAITVTAILRTKATDAANNVNLSPNQ